MQFYKVEGIAEHAEEIELEDRRRGGKAPAPRRGLSELCMSLCEKAEEFNDAAADRTYCFVVRVAIDPDGDRYRLGVLTESPERLREHLGAFTDALGLALRYPAPREITLEEIKKLLLSACRNDLIGDDDEVLERFGLDGFGRLHFGEKLIVERSRKQLLREAQRCLASESLLEELGRICAPAKEGAFPGHPVQYLILADDHDACGEIGGLLLSALYANGRLRGRRFCRIGFASDFRMPENAYDNLYRSCEGGAMLVYYTPADDEENEHASSDRTLIESLCAAMKRHRRDVLTIFCLPQTCVQAKEILYEEASGVTLIEIAEHTPDAGGARAFLRNMAKEAGVSADKSLTAFLEKGKTYPARELRQRFDEWYECKLKTEFYPQYAETETTRRRAAKARPRGSAYDELQAMIGLAEAKRVVDRALAYHKAQHIFADRGMQIDTPAMHMCFTGSPGTAKTTVARLFAAILRENGVLPRGHLVEVGRGDLVGRFVGWTAPTIQKKFREAMGGVLFIDEAYSLLDDRSGSFGDEAINTIVQEMENHRKDVIVIFAGYPEPMERFLARNPGLRSRIAFHVPFEDYTADELCKISALLAKQKGMTLSEGAVGKLRGVFETARKCEDFGNGRFARSILEQARMAQAVRLLRDSDAAERADVTTLLAEDIEPPPALRTEARRTIGFSCA